MCDIDGIENVVGKLAGIYGIQAGPGGPIKIGEAADVRARLRTLQTAHHETLSIVYFEWWADLKDRRTIERRRHKEFAAHHLRGEWFSAAILPELEEVQFSADLIETLITKNYNRAIEILRPRPQSLRTT